MPPVKIAFGHKARSGKDTAIEHLSTKYRVYVIRFAGALYDIMNYAQRRVGLTVTKDGPAMQVLGQLFRDRYGSGIWMDATLAEYKNVDQDKYDIIAVADMRYRTEADALRATGFYLVDIDRPSRPIDRDPNHSSEVDLDGYPFDEVIVNDGTLEEFKTKVDAVVTKLTDG